MVHFITKKHKIYLYKEDFSEFKDSLNEMISFIIDEKGEEVISDRHQSDYKNEETEETSSETEENSTSNFTDVDFDDI